MDLLSSHGLLNREGWSMVLSARAAEARKRYTGTSGCNTFYGLNKVVLSIGLYIEKWARLLQEWKNG